jgi:16S rRNA (cytidine1402-2'-O)-methyltransferase
VASGMRLKDACAQLAVDGVSKRDLYEAVLAARSSADDLLT